MNTVGSFSYVTQLIGRKWLKLLTEKQSKKKQPFFGSFEKPRVKISTIHCTYSCTCNFTMTYFSVSWYWIHAYIIINGIVIHGQVTTVLHFMSQRSDYTMAKHIVRRMLQRSLPVRYGLTFSNQVVTRVQWHILSGKNDDLYLTELWPWCKLTWHLLIVCFYM